MVHDFEIRLPDILCEEGRNTIRHFVQHGAHAPPIRFASVPILLVLLPPTFVVVHLECDESLLMGLQDLGRNVVASPTWYEAVVQRNRLTSVNRWRKQWGRRTEVDQPNVRSAGENEVVWLYISGGKVRDCDTEPP